MHLKTDLLRAFIDDELPASRAEQVEQHLTRCPACRSQYETLQTRARRVKIHMDAIAPGLTEEHRSPHLALSRFTSSTRKHNSRKENFQTMLTRKPLWTALAVVAILAIALSITPVRAWASDLLSLFRVEKITVIQFDPKAARQANEGLSVNKDAIQKILDKNLKVSEDGKLTEVATVEEAAAGAGFTPRIPSGFTDLKLAYKPGMHASLTIDRPQMQEILDAVGADVQLPEAVDGKTVDVNVQATVAAADGCSPDASQADLPEGCTVLIQLPSPTVDAPEGLDIKKTGAAMLQLLGLSADEATRLSQRIDWTTTLLLPIPTDQSIQVSDLPVDGVSGTLLLAENQNMYTLLWVKDGMLYALRGQGGAEKAQAIASTMP
jgi:hypothetical protein